jgi:hypothetical protein
MKNMKIARALRVLDYVVGGATVGYGLVTARPLFVGFGVAGLVLAHLNLSERMAQGLRKYFGRKSERYATPPGQELDAGPAPCEPPTPSTSYAAMRLQVGSSLTSASRHSVLNAATHLNHAHTSQK